MNPQQQGYNYLPLATILAQQGASATGNRRLANGINLGSQLYSIYNTANTGQQPASATQPTMQQMPDFNLSNLWKMFGGQS